MHRLKLKKRLFSPSDLTSNYFICFSLTIKTRSLALFSTPTDIIIGDDLRDTQYFRNFDSTENSLPPRVQTVTGALSRGNDRPR